MKPEMITQITASSTAGGGGGEEQWRAGVAGIVLKQGNTALKARKQLSVQSRMRQQCKWSNIASAAPGAARPLWLAPTRYACLVHERAEVEAPGGEQVAPDEVEHHLRQEQGHGRGEGEGQVLISLVQLLPTLPRCSPNAHSLLPWPSHRSPVFAAQPLPWPL